MILLIALYNTRAGPRLLIKMEIINIFPTYKQHTHSTVLGNYSEQLLKKYNLKNDVYPNKRFKI